MRPDWMFLKNAFLLVTISGSLAACSPARWQETQAQPPVPVIQQAQPPVIHGQEVPVQQQQPTRPTVTVPERDKNDDETGIIYEEEDNQNEGGLSGEIIEIENPRPAPQPTPAAPVVVAQPDCCYAPAEPTPCPEDMMPVPNKPKKKKPVHPATPKKPRPSGPTTAQIGPDTYFVVQNIATEKLRLYKTGENGASHKLVLETDMVVGHDSKSHRSILGQFEIVRWVKFYEDQDALYPSYYNPRYPRLPQAGSSFSAWLSESLLPQKSGRVRGLYGWFTAILGPNADNHGMYGTWGWGSDGDRMIRALRSAKWDNDLRIASRGGSRVENRAIALLRELLVPGSKVIKIYAREAYSRPEAQIHANGQIGSWQWALTSEGINETNGARAGRNSVLARSVPANMILEEGVYKFNQTPTAVPVRNMKNPHTSGNTYRLPNTSLKGVFLVDSGRLVDYRHPRELEIGGRKAEMPARYLARKNTKFYLPSTK